MPSPAAEAALTNVRRSISDAEVAAFSVSMTAQVCVSRRPLSMDSPMGSPLTCKIINVYRHFCTEREKKLGSSGQFWEADSDMRNRLSKNAGGTAPPDST